MKKLLPLAAALASLSCEKSPAPVANQPATSPPHGVATPAKRPAQVKPPAAAAVDPAALFTEKKIRGFAVYERETAGLEPAARNAALAKSGLTDAEVAELRRILSDYISKRWLAVGHANAKGYLAKVHKRLAAEADEAKAKLEKQHGKVAIAVVTAHEKELFEAHLTRLKVRLQLDRAPAADPEADSSRP